MTVESRNNIIAIIAAITLGAVLIVSLISILVLAALHDGELANHALDTFNQIIVVVVPAIAALAGIDKLVSGITASKSITATAAVGVAQATNGMNGMAAAVSALPVVPAVSEGVSSPAGASLPSDAPTSPALDNVTSSEATS
jgi:hypothetical protein